MTAEIQPILATSLSASDVRTLRRSKGVSDGTCVCVLEPEEPRNSHTTLSFYRAFLAGLGKELGQRLGEPDAKYQEDLCKAWGIACGVDKLVVLSAHRADHGALTDMAMMAAALDCQLVLIFGRPLKRRQRNWLDDWTGVASRHLAEAVADPTLTWLGRRLDRREPRALQKETTLSANEADPLFDHHGDFVDLADPFTFYRTVSLLLPPDEATTAQRTYLSALRAAASLVDDVKPQLSHRPLPIATIANLTRDLLNGAEDFCDAKIAVRALQKVLAEWCGIRLSIDLNKFLASTVGTPEALSLNPAAWDALSGYPLPYQPAACALSASGLSPAEMALILCDDVSADGSSVAVEGETIKIAAAGQVFIRAQMAWRIMAGPSVADTYLMINVRAPGDTPSPQGIAHELTRARRILGYPFGAGQHLDWTHRPHATWFRRLGLKATPVNPE